MTDNHQDPFEQLKEILGCMRTPEELESHPWAEALFVGEAVRRNPDLARLNTGQRLINAITGLFSQMKPANPPRRGLRLDPRWGEFGLLAALYFMPYENGTSFPTSYIDAWRRIDPAILYYVYGKPAQHLSQEEREAYQLVGAELNHGSPSTLSDWHKKGVQRLTETILNRERYLSRAASKHSSLLRPEQDGDPDRSETADTDREKERAKDRANPFAFLRASLLVLILGAILLLGLGSFKAWQVYQQGQALYQNVTGLRELKRQPLGIDSLQKANPMLQTVQTDLRQFKAEVEPFLWLSPSLAWVPVHGGDLAAAPELLSLSEHLVEASLLTIQAAQPFLSEYESQASSLGPAGLTALLVQAQPQFLAARAEFDRALLARNQIQADKLSPRLQTLLEDDLDPLLELADDGLSLATALPGILGATQEGPKTYLLLIQNEDELRATGGFITTVGNLVLSDGQVIDLEFEGVDRNVQEDWTKPYPAAPWQLKEYMNSRVLILRDSNWFTDFPTSALWAEYLYAYKHAHSVDGVIAIDQHFLVMLLGQLGPLEVDEAPYPLTSENVIAYMREARTPPEGEPRPVDWYRKDFIDKISKALLGKLLSGQDLDWQALTKTLTQALAERHLLVQFDDAQVTALLAERGWDNALLPGAGDYLMAVDTNVGFNKTNALVDASLSYDVDLSDPASPRASLLVSHHNRADPRVQCIHWGYEQTEVIETYPVNRCYWNYLRIYKQQGSELLQASPHAVGATQMLLGKEVPARVDDLEVEAPGVRGYGTLLIVPGGQSWNTGFEFSLPPSVLTRDEESGALVYHLKVQKQPGTLAIPITVRLHLPNQAKVISTSMQAIVQDNNVLISTDLRTDLEVDIVFSQP